MGVGGGASPWETAPVATARVVTGRVAAAPVAAHGGAPLPIVTAQVVAQQQPSAAEQAGYGGAVGGYVISQNDLFSPDDGYTFEQRPSIRAKTRSICKLSLALCVAAAVSVIVGAVLQGGGDPEGGIAPDDTALSPADGVAISGLLPPPPPLPPPLSRCDESTWPSVGSVCEDCKVVVLNFRSQYDGASLH